MTGAPAETPGLIAGLDAGLSAEAEGIARGLIVGPGVAPGCVMVVAARTKGRWVHGIGWAGRLGDVERRAVAADTPFDLASVTKPFFAAAVRRLVAAGRIDWRARLDELLPEARGTACADATLELLLSHRAGLDAHRPLYEPLTRGLPVDRATALRTAADALRPGCSAPRPADGHPPLYSDLGYLLAGEAVARASQLPLDEVVAREVCAPLGLRAACAAGFRRVDPTFDARVAATEHVAWRGGEIRGATHDENAWALAGAGLAGHAGLFGTGDAVARFGAAMVDALADRSGWLSAEDAAELVRARPGGTLRAGFDGKSAEGASSGARFGPLTFGHLGFTGTSLWCDPEAGVVAALLTNRVCPSRDHVAIRAARPLAHDAAFEAALRRALTA